MYDLCRNEWRPPTAARATAAGHQEEVLRAAVTPVITSYSWDAWNIMQSVYIFTLYIFVLHETM